jgi:tyrosyl-tRNA synthetase
MLEFMYPLLQGYDSVELKADVELGGTDQKFNLLVGRELQRQWGQEAQVVMTMPILEGTDGKRKMSKSFGNAIALNDSAENMYGGVMSIPDHLIVRYTEYLTETSDQEKEKLEKGLASGSLHPRAEKARLARQLVAMYYGKAEAEGAETHFDRVFKSGALPEEISEAVVKKASMDLITLLAETGLAQSRAAARRLIEQGAVEIDEERQTEPDVSIALDRPRIIRCGKRKFLRVRCAS